MIKHLVLFWLLLTPVIIFAKQTQSDTARYKAPILWIVNFSDGREPVLTRYFLVDRKNEEYQSFLKERTDYNAFEHLNAKIVSIIKLKPGTQPLTLSDLYNRYKIPKQYRKLTVRFDDEIMDHPETMLTSANQIRSVKIKNSKTGKYIEIISTNYESIKEMRESYRKCNNVGQQ
ncbi:hypothetical protein [Mucilaginibacter defluvii]|uniref:Uncharacterized protein n=1 Tax=Mucilaginibacter defluvii TaxID=1196019 RepID=A0ABP9FZL1_9SPHI